MQGPRGTTPGDTLFTTHSYVGVVSFGLILLFWLNLLARRIGTEPGALFPWPSARRRSALWADMRAQFGALARLRLPHYVEGSALASAVHGLGLLLVTLMAGTGTLWWWLEPAGTARAIEEIHKLFANLAWAYLIAHAGLAVLHRLRGEASLSEMWSLRGRN
jgi:cytochrome b561